MQYLDLGEVDAELEVNVKRRHRVSTWSLTGMLLKFILHKVAGSRMCLIPLLMSGLHHPCSRSIIRWSSIRLTATNTLRIMDMESGITTKSISTIAVILM